ncbi:DUF1385 domain-containing protein [Brevibacillus laterosporus]|nr:DUF1385 domain-containing protein [Brevibacillus laterosporus]
MSRVLHNCGTNYVIFTILVYILIGLLYPIDTILAMLVSLMIGYELYKLDHSNIIAKPFYLVGGFLQKYLVTSNPTDIQIDTAIVALEGLVKDKPTLIIEGM